MIDSKDICTAEESLIIYRIVPNVCRYESCFKIAFYRFTKSSRVGNLTIDASSNSDGHMFINDSTITIGYSCEHHVEEVNKLLKNIHKVPDNDK